MQNIIPSFLLEEILCSLIQLYMNESIDLVVTLIDIMLLKQIQFTQNENFYLHEASYPS